MTATIETSKRIRGWTIFERAGRALLDTLYPPVCLSCRLPVADPHKMCAACWKQITFLDGPLCACCGLPFEIDPGIDTRCAACLAREPVFDSARAAVKYDDASRGAILALKRSDRLELADLFAAWLKLSGRTLIEAADAIVPVPLHRTRLWSRRYNQSAILAQRLHLLTGKPYDPFLVERVRQTPSQADMPSAKARLRNVKGAFRVPERQATKVEGRKILLVDDVLTTGATVEACARALKRAGATKVFVLTIARVARPLPHTL